MTALREPELESCHLCLGAGACPTCDGDGERKPGLSVNEVRRQSKRRTLTRLRDALAAALEEVDIEIEGL